MNVLKRQWLGRHNPDYLEETITARFERQVAAAPDKLAIVTDDRSPIKRSILSATCYRG
jgi:hypothetical protein